MLKAIGNFFRFIFVTPAWELFVVTVVVLVCMQAMVAPFFYYPPDKAKRGKSKITSTPNGK